MNTAELANDPDLAVGMGKALKSHLHRTVFWGICAGLAALCLFTANGIITPVAILMLPILVGLLWRLGEPPVLLYACSFQWLQASAAIFYTNHFGQTLDEAFGSTALSFATWLSLIAVVVLACGIRCGYVGAGPPRMSELEEEASRLDVKKLGVLYAISLVGSFILTAVGWHFSTIRQPLLAFAALKWGVVFLICYTVLQQRRGYGLLFACVMLEFILGFSGIYASFKCVFFVLVIAAMSSPRMLRGRRLAITSVCFVALFIMGVVWTTIKMDYRTFLIEEADAAGEAVPIERKFTKLTDLVEDVTWDNFLDGMDALIMRISYVNFFALTTENVPGRIPYENGALWSGSIVHILMPRVLFPDKPILDDSERTRTYTGVNVAGSEQDTSIGIGYVGESYIDFGPVGMFIPIFLLGLLYGVINRFFITRTRYKLLGSALAVSVLVFNAYEIETSNIKLLGGVITALLAATVFYKALGGSVMAYLQGSAVGASVWSQARVRKI